MRKIAIILTLLAVSASFTFGQTAPDSISMKKVFGGYQFYQGEQIIQMNQLVNSMKSNDLAYKQIKSAQSLSAFASVLGGVGGFMIGWPIGTSLGGGEPEWAMAGIGAGLLVASIPIIHSMNKKAKKAIDIYNGGLMTSSFWDDKELILSTKGNGIGLTLYF